MPLCIALLFPFSDGRTGPVFSLDIAGQPFVVLNTLEAAIELFGTLTSARTFV